MTEVASQPFGSALLAALAAGLAGYAVYRLVEAARGRGRGGVVRRRLAPAARAAVNGGLAVLAVRQLIGARRTEESSVTAVVLAWPAGAWLVGGLGVAIAAVGVHQFTTAWRGDTDELTVPGAVPARARPLTRVIGIAGFVGRGVVFALVGGFLVRAAVRHDPESGVGLDAALRELLDAPFGTPLLVVVAAGLILFGLHCAIEARYAR
jgi:hypothetical protein